MSKHTPGPWSVEFEDHIMSGVEHREPGLRRGKCMTEVARVNEDDCDTEEMEANARLIAAAPELLEALRLVLVDPECLSLRHETSRAVLSAIAKVEGR